MKRLFILVAFCLVATSGCQIPSWNLRGNGDNSNSQQLSDQMGRLRKKESTSLPYAWDSRARQIEGSLGVQ